MERLIERLGAERAARWEDRVRRYAVAHIPDRWAIAGYSAGRQPFLDALKEETVDEPFQPPATLEREYWGLTFQSPVMNAAGMFKTDAYYDLVADQGAGAYLAGTFTPDPRQGNDNWGILRPFLPLPRSEASLNSLGLPNPGFRADAAAQEKREEIGYGTTAQEELEAVPRRDGVPVGASVMGDPGTVGTPGYAQDVVDGLEAVAAAADFAEINESCPNTGDEPPQESAMADRLEYVADQFLDGNSLPVIVKFSTDTAVRRAEDIVDILIDLGFHGVNFGNTSRRYDDHRDAVAEAERGVYDTFTQNIGGGVGGRPLKQRSLELARRAAERVRERDLDRDFMVVRTGGVENGGDVADAERCGVGMSQWFTGYWDAFAEHGHDVYRQMLAAAAQDG